MRSVIISDEFYESVDGLAASLERLEEWIEGARFVLGHDPFIGIQESTNIWKVGSNSLGEPSLFEVYYCITERHVILLKLDLLQLVDDDMPD